MSAEVKNIVESVIFASEEEISPKQIKEVLDSFQFKTSLNEVEEYIAELNKEYHESNRPYKIIKIAGGYQFSTKADYAKYIGKLFTEKQKKKLSPSALETLAVIAYKQPITRSDIEFVRGVNVDYIVNSLLERELITIIGRAPTPGRPILYGTTKNFLKVIGLGSLDDLPKLKEINEILKNEHIDGITEADIDLFNSINNPVNDEGQLELDEESSDENESEEHTPEEHTAVDNVVSEETEDEGNDDVLDDSDDDEEDDDEPEETTEDIEEDIIEIESNTDQEADDVSREEDYNQ